MEKLPKLTKAKQVGKNLTVTLEDGTVMTKTGSKEELEPVKAAIEAYKARPIKALFTKLKAMLAPKATETKENKEKESAVLKGRIKAGKKEVKEIKKGKTTISKTSAKVNLVKELESQMKGNELSEADANAMRKLLAKSDAAKASAPREASRTTRRGEY